MCNEVGLKFMRVDSQIKVNENEKVKWKKTEITIISLNKREDL